LTTHAVKSAGQALRRWTLADSEELYGIGNWGRGYFDMSEDGEVRVLLRRGDQTRPTSLMEIVAGMKERGLSFPVLLRFGDVLDTRIELLNTLFEKAIKDSGYRNSYRGVFPIKVNQQQQVIEEITRFGRKYHHGLEAGSKAELVAALAYMNDPEAFIICNGYKDNDFIDLALYGLKMGIQVIPVIEMPGELDVLLERAKRLKIRPRLGVRVKLATEGSGHWIESGGDRSVFGLNMTQLIDVVDRLREVDMLDCLELLHYHIGSQIPTIRTIRTAANEAARVYVDLVREGAKMGIMNTGGGLGVDYDGSNTASSSSTNYTMQEYCADIVEAVMSVADEAGVEHPVLISESGRATVAHYSVLLFNIMDVCTFEHKGPPETLPDDVCEQTKNLKNASDILNPKNLKECYNDALYYRDKIRSLFAHGDVSLRERALAESIFWNIMSRVAVEAPRQKNMSDELKNLKSAMADVYYGNFSLFQSLPDAWAIDQLFPILPVHRLNERPTRTGIIADCTCDCDGKIDRFIDMHDVKKGLPLHELRSDEEYILGAFLVGAYQETLGDLHNLFGDTNVISIRLDDDGEVEFTREIIGDSVADVLAYVEYDPKNLVEKIRAHAESSVRRRQISAQERREIMSVFEEILRGHTYFDM